jgi:hypothetical protein
MSLYSSSFKSFATAHSGLPIPALWPIAHNQMPCYGP